MRELQVAELEKVQGGLEISMSVVTLVITALTATIYLGNSLVNLYLYEKTGSLPPQPSLPI